MQLLRAAAVLNVKRYGRTSRRAAPPGKAGHQPAKGKAVSPTATRPKGPKVPTPVAPDARRLARPVRGGLIGVIPLGRCRCMAEVLPRGVIPIFYPICGCAGSAFDPADNGTGRQGQTFVIHSAKAVPSEAGANPVSGVRATAIQNGNSGESPVRFVQP